MIEIPVITGSDGVVLPAFSVTTAIEGVNYILSFRWNGRGQFWALDVSDSFGTPILFGNGMHLGAIFNFPKNAALPPGALALFDTSGRDVEPTQFDLGDRVKIVYFSAAEMA